MQVEIEKTPIEGVIVVKADVFEDERGFFMEVFRKDQFVELGLPWNFVQLNHSASVRNVVRGLHFQWEPPMGKLMRVTTGAAFLVAVDIRKNSPTLGEWFGIEASAKNKIQLWAPACFARGFAVLSDYAEIQYLCTGIYGPTGESGILWNDPKIGIDWPVKDPILSEKDRKAQTLAQWLKRTESSYFQM
jgi:dTDP-4-dehydrorhamnose 3,5-epimerase